MRDMTRADLASPPAHRTALIVAHGQPSEPAPAIAELAALASRVADHLPGWRVLSATLADEGDLRAVIAAAAGAPLTVYPLFMADGWFTQVHLPARLSAAGSGRVTMLDPFGLDPAVQALTVRLARAAEASGATGLLLAAHGSSRSPAPARVAKAMAARIRTETGLDPVAAAFIDERPRIAEVAASLPAGAACLPFFAARGGHVIDDLPAALAEAGFAGPLLPPVGLHSTVPALIAAALARAA
jgi:sirohydrochlorin ferrochelatase